MPCRGHEIGTAISMCVLGGCIIPDNDHVVVASKYVFRSLE